MKRIMILLSMIGLLSASSCGLIDDITGDDDDPEPEVPVTHPSYESQDKPVQAFDIDKIMLQSLFTAEDGEWVVETRALRDNNHYYEETAHDYYSYVNYAFGKVTPLVTIYGRVTDLDEGGIGDDGLLGTNIVVASMGYDSAYQFDQVEIICIKDWPNDNNPANAVLLPINDVETESRPYSPSFGSLRGIAGDTTRHLFRVVALTEGALGYTTKDDPVQEITFSTNPEYYGLKRQAKPNDVIIPANRHGNAIIYNAGLYQYHGLDSTLYRTFSTDFDSVYLSILKVHNDYANTRENDKYTRPYGL